MLSYHGISRKLWQTMSNRHSSSSIGYQSNSESRTSYVFWCTTFILVRLHNIWVTVSPRSLHPRTGTDSDRVTRLTAYCREHAPSLANVVSTTPVRPPGTLCHLTYIIMTLLTLTCSRNDLKLFCLIVRTDLLSLLYGISGRFVWAAPYKSLIVFVFVRLEIDRLELRRLPIDLIYVYTCMVDGDVRTC